MQDVHAIGGGGGRLFTATTAGSGVGIGGGDRRVRPQNHHNHQPLKCPRCDSLNTKFCYYNNYNLSQPRHFCKSCRRYWTKGGVLRNVPVGGGCRKSKRSKPTSSAAASIAATADAAEREQNSTSHSSSESSTLTAATTANKTTGATAEVVSATDSNVLTFADSSSFLTPQSAAANPGSSSSSFDYHQQLIDHHAASEEQLYAEFGRLSHMMTSSNQPKLLVFNSDGNLTYRLQQNEQASIPQDHNTSKMVGTTADQEEMKMLESNSTTGYSDRTVQFDLTAFDQSKGVSNGGGSATDHGMFDFTEAVDHAYWSQTQWPDTTDQSLNFLP